MWHILNPRLLAQERKYLLGKFPSLELWVAPTGFCPCLGTALRTAMVVLTGRFALDDAEDEGGYQICVVTPPDYPREFPLLYCTDPRIPRTLARHVQEDGQACLCVDSEQRCHLPQGGTLVSFLQNLVRPFLIGQFYCDVHPGAPWPWPDRSHGILGIVESWQERLAVEDIAGLAGLLQLVLQDESLGIGTPCVCGSGRAYEECHRNLVCQIRSETDTYCVAKELRLIEECPLLPRKRSGTPWNRGRNAHDRLLQEFELKWGTLAI